MSDRAFVVDGDARIVQVGTAGKATIASTLGQSLWTCLPAAQPLLDPLLDEAKSTGAVVESTIFYAGGTFDVRVAPMGTCMAVRLQRRSVLDLRTLGTLAASLRSIEAELAAREHVRRDRRAPASLQALP